MPTVRGWRLWEGVPWKQVELKMSMPEHYQGVLLESPPVKGKRKKQAWTEGEVRLHAVAEALVNPTGSFESRTAL